MSSCFSAGYSEFPGAPGSEAGFVPIAISNSASRTFEWKGEYRFMVAGFQQCVVWIVSGGIRGAGEICKDVVIGPARHGLSVLGDSTAMVLVLRYSSSLLVKQAPWGSNGTIVSTLHNLLWQDFDSSNRSNDATSAAGAMRNLGFSVVELVSIQVGAVLDKTN